MKYIVRIVSIVALVAMLAGCFSSTPSRPQHRDQRDIVAAGVHVDVLGLGASLGGDIHASGGGRGGYGDGRHAMMIRPFDPCDPALQEPGRAWVEAAASQGANGGKWEHARASVHNGRPYCGWTSEGGSSSGNGGRR